MIVEIKSPTEIKLTPETTLEDAVITGKEWVASIKNPEPLEINKRCLVLKAKPVECKTL